MGASTTGIPRSARIESFTLVTKSITKPGIYAGNPARLIRAL